MERRRLLTVGSLILVILLSGCSAAGSLEMQPTTDDAELAEQLSRQTTIPEGESIRHRQIARQAIESGSTTAQSRSPLIDPGLPYAYQGQYYNISSAVVNQQPGTAVSLEIDYNGTGQHNATIAYSSLSARDRALIDEVLPPKREQRSDGYDFGTSVTYNETELNRSLLLTEEYDAVRYEGETYPINIRDTRSVTIKTYQYTASAVATSSTEYATQLRDEYLFTLSGLSEAEQKVVEQAVNDTYYADNDDDETFRAVMETFQQQKAIQKDEYRGTWLVRYNGGIYVAELSYEGFNTDVN
jgi:hypothetical protein